MVTYCAVRGRCNELGSNIGNWRHFRGLARLRCLALLLLSATLVSTAQAADDAARSGPRVFNNLAYGGAGKYQTLDLYLPEPSETAVPLVIWIHGGGWSGGDKDGKSPAGGLLEKGFAVASINYRLSTIAAYPAQLQDCQAAVRYLRMRAGKYGIDPDRIGVWGSSAGGHLAAMVGVMSDRQGKSTSVQAVCDWCGPADLVRAIPDSPPDCPLDIADLLWKLFLGPRAGNKRLRQSLTVPQRTKLLASGSPVNYVSGKEPPFLIMHGDADKTVPIVQSRRLVEVLKEAGVDVTFREISGAGHSLHDRPACFDEAARFFERTLKAAPVERK